MRRALTIAGSDSGGGAGVQADLKAFAAVGVHGTSVVTCVTAQNTEGVRRVDTLPTDAVEAQLAAVFEDLAPHAVKTGMLFDAATVRLVARHAERLDVPLVVDPVMVSTSGDALHASDLTSELTRLVARAALVTPNAAELSALAGCPVRDLKEAVEAARALLGAGARAVLAKGGHLAGPDAVDVLVTPNGERRFAFPRVGGPFHGAGCHYASLIAGLLARGRALEAAVDEARSRMHVAIQRAYKPGRGPAVLDVLGVDATGGDAGPEAAAVAAAAWRFVARAHLDLIPEVGTNIAFLPAGTTDPRRAAGLSQRITRGADGPTAPGPARVGSSGHVARVAAAAAATDPACRAAMNLRFGRRVRAALDASGLDHASFERSGQPPRTSSVEWGTAHAITRHGRVPDAVWDEGAPGKEAMVRLLAPTPEGLVEKALRLQAALSRS